MAHKIDKRWFIDRQRDLGVSQTEFARRLGLDKASWSRTLAGHRKMTDEEKLKAAKVVGVPLHELLPHVGLPLDPRVAGPGTHTTVRETSAKARPGCMAGVVDAAQGAVTFEPGGLLQDEAGLFVTGDEWLTGWIVECRPAAVEATPSKGHEAGIVQLRDGRLLLRKIRPGFIPGLFDLGPFLGFGDQENGVSIVGIIPVTGVWRP